jgi:non-specific protein-tyrosine kinase
LAVGGTSAQAATDLANSYAKTVEGAVNAAYATYRKSLTATQKLTQPNSSSGFVIVAPALASGAVKLKSPKVVYKPPLGRRKAGLFGAGLGLLLGVLILLVRELLNRSVQSAAATESSFLYPVVAEIPERPAKGPGSTAGLLGVVEEPTSPAAEAYRMLRMSVLFEGLAPAVAPDDLYGAAEGPSRSLMRGPYQAPSPGSRQVVLVVSAGSEDSRPVVAANLSAAYAEAGERVIVISTGDLDAGYRPGQTVDRTTDIEAWELAAKLEPSNLENVARLSLRPFVASSGLLAARAPGIFAAARRLADVVIVEAPPLLAVHHGEALVHAVDVVVVVAESRSTKMDDARRAGEVLRRMGAPVLGVALTRVRLSAGDVRQASGPPGLPRPTEPPGPVHQPIQESTRA